MIGSGVLRRKPQSTFCMIESLASLRRAYLGSFFWGPEDIMNLRMGAIWSFGKGIGLVSDYGAQRICFKA
jgi:hypothetical protein